MVENRCQSEKKRERKLKQIEGLSCRVNVYYKNSTASNKTLGQQKLKIALNKNKLRCLT